MKTVSFTCQLVIVVAFMFAVSSGFAQKPASEKNDTVVRNVQVSLLPFVNFNAPPTANHVNVSINILAGYTKEVRSFEIGSLLNMVQTDAKSCQLAGVGNIVMGASRGLQAAGNVNVAKSMHGVQLSGVVNTVLNNSESCQLAGVANVVGGSSRGLQAAGVLNASKNLKGLQAAGVLNLVANSAESCQLAGVVNFVGDSAHGFQGAGVLNYATNLKGSQIAGVINVAKSVKGFQLGVVNVSDSCSGTPIGVFSFVRQGYHKIELSTDELLFSNIAFRTGVNRFHNLFTAGIRPDNFENPLWMFGYGVGTTFRTTDRLFFDIDLSAQQIVKGNYLELDNEIYKLYMGIDFKIAGKTSIAAGLSYNFFRTETDSPQYDETFSKIAPYSFTNKTYGNDTNLKSWLGAKVAIRFL